MIGQQSPNILRPQTALLLRIVGLVFVASGVMLSSSIRFSSAEATSGKQHVTADAARL